MKFSIYIVIITLIQLGFLQVCPVFQCYEFPNENACAMKSQGENGFVMNLRGCNTTINKDYVCPLSAQEEEEDICALPSPKKVFPGEVCNTTEDCISGTCENKLCVGKKEGDKCGADYECGPNLYCLETCKPAIKNGEPCNTTDKCKADALCLQNKCVQYASIDNNQPALVPATCKSLFMYEGKCSAGPTLSEDNKKTNICIGRNNLEPICKYSISNGPSFNESCTCGMTNTTFGLCKLGEGDYQVDYVNLYKPNILFLVLYLYFNWKIG